MNRILGIDFGRTRIGLAISDELRFLAHPFETIAAGRDSIARIATIVSQNSVDCVVVGVPKLMSGKMGSAAGEAAVFMDKLRAALKCKVVPWDERLTTVAAHRALQEAGKKTRATRGYVDQVAAQMILQGYLDQQQMAESSDESSG